MSAVGSCVIGTIASFHLNAATGPTIVLVQSGFFCAALLINVLRRSEWVRGSTANAAQDP
jgi:manganese/iron transport system permease protein